MRKFALALFVVLSIAACSSTDSNSETPQGSYDRTALLTHWADDIIIPSYENYEQAVNNLSDKATAFTSAPDEAKLVALRTAWFDAYRAYQYTAIYNFGIADSQFYNESSNTYPCNASGIQSNINSGNYNLAQFSQYDKQGFPALDYLINGLGSANADIVNFYVSNPQAAAYRNYLMAVVNRLAAVLNAVLNDWHSTYRDTYVANTGTAVSSSVNKTTNNFVKHLEKDIRTAKLGIPAGEFSNGMLYPEKLEAYYSGTASKQMLLVALQASQDFFNGRSVGGNSNGLGLKDYLDHVGAVRNGTPLSTTIDNQYNATRAAVEALNNNLRVQISSDNAPVVQAFDVLQQNVIYIKLDMMQALNISIDYVDGDGD